MELVFPPLSICLVPLCTSAREEIIIVSPWIKLDALNLIRPNQHSVKWHVLTRGALLDFLTGSSDLQAIETLHSLGAKIGLVSNLHAKIYVIDRRHAIITSANLTIGGLHDNLELSVLLNDPDEIDLLLNTFAGWMEQARPLDNEWLSRMKGMIRANENIRQQALELNDSIQEGTADVGGGQCIFVPGQVLRPKWLSEITRWCSQKKIPNVETVIQFLVKAFQYLPYGVFEHAWFGIHSNYVSLIVGNIWLASIWAARESAWLLVDKDWDRISKATVRYAPLGWKVVPWRSLPEIIGQKEIWESYSAAAEKALDAPIGRLVIPKNLRNKQRLRDVTTYFPNRKVLGHRF